MIFVTVGTHYQGFDRLIKKADEIAGKIDEKVIAQIGSTKFLPKNMIYFKFIKDEKKLLELHREARIIISHAGAGTLFTIFNNEKPVVIVPRLKKFNEAIDNHQLELSEVLKNEKKAVVVYNIDNLEKALKQAKKITFIKNKKLVNFLKNYITDMEK
jgi:UDP-N-acetylglucosamine transferase subunit ALG13